MAGAEIRRFASDQRNMALNFGLGIGNGALLALAETLLYPAVILTFFVTQLAASNFQIALVTALAGGIWFLPRFIAVITVRGRHRQLPWATAGTMIQAISIAVLALGAFRADSAAGTGLLRTFFICYIVFIVAASFTQGPSNDLMIKATAPQYRRWFFRQRNLWGAVLAIIAAFVIRQVLGADGAIFPHNFALIFITAAMALAAAGFLQAMIREPRRIISHQPNSSGRSIRDLANILGDVNFRRFLLFRVLLSLSMLADPFFIVYALRELHVSGSMIGTYIVALVVARFVTVPLWTLLRNRVGDRAVLQSAALLRLFAPAIAVLLPYIMKADLYQQHVKNDQTALYLFGVIFAIYGAALSGQTVANFSYMLDLAPEPLRATYIGFTNIVLAVTAFSPLIGAVIINRYGMDRVFLAAALFGLLAVFASGLLTNTYTRFHVASSAWRLRKTRSSPRTF